jgi:hypothetical protein
VRAIRRNAGGVLVTLRTADPHISTSVPETQIGRYRAGEARESWYRFTHESFDAARPSPHVNEYVETVAARGHDNVAAAHASTFEVTTDDWLTPAGDCIVGVAADRAPEDFDPAFVAACRDPESDVEVVLRADGHETRVRARGDPDLTFASDRSLVVRTSDYVDDRTVAVGADAAAVDLDRGLVAALADGADLTARLRVRRP